MYVQIVIHDTTNRYVAYVLPHIIFMISTTIIMKRIAAIENAKYMAMVEKSAIILLDGYGFWSEHL